jgi:hypothetical protein
MSQPAQALAKTGTPPGRPRVAIYCLNRNEDDPEARTVHRVLAERFHDVLGDVDVEMAREPAGWRVVWVISEWSQRSAVREQVAAALRDAGLPLAN